MNLYSNTIAVKNDFKQTFCNLSMLNVIPFGFILDLCRSYLHPESNVYKASDPADFRITVPCERVQGVLVDVSVDFSKGITIVYSNPSKVLRKTEVMKNVKDLLHAPTLHQFIDVTKANATYYEMTDDSAIALAASLNQLIGKLVTLNSIVQLLYSASLSRIFGYHLCVNFSNSNRYQNLHCDTALYFTYTRETKHLHVAYYDSDLKEHNLTLSLNESNVLTLSESGPLINHLRACVATDEQLYYVFRALAGTPWLTVADDVWHEDFMKYPIPKHVLDDMFVEGGNVRCYKTLEKSDDTGIASAGTVVVTPSNLNPRGVKFEVLSEFVGELWVGDVGKDGQNPEASFTVSIRGTGDSDGLTDYTLIEVRGVYFNHNNHVCGIGRQIDGGWLGAEISHIPGMKGCQLSPDLEYDPIYHHVIGYMFEQLVQQIININATVDIRKAVIKTEK